jgi:hypothetical protein
MPTSALIAGGLGAAGSLGQGLLGFLGSQNATKANLGFQGQALDSLKQYLGPLLAQGQDIAGSALGPLKKLLTPGADMTSTLSQMPGFKFAQDWGQQAVKNLGTTTGLGGNTLTAGASYATGLAQQGYGNIVSQLQNFLNSGIGLESSAAGALGGGTAGILGKMGDTAGAGILGQTNALSQGLGGMTSNIGNAFMLNSLFNKLSLGNKGGGIYGSASPGADQ